MAPAAWLQEPGAGLSQFPPQSHTRASSAEHVLLSAALIQPPQAAGTTGICLVAWKLLCASFYIV